MLSLLSLLATAALVSLQCKFEAHAHIIDNPKMDIDNSLQPNVVSSPKHKLKKFVRIMMAPPPALEASVGEKLVLQCQVSGAPSPSVAWLRNGEPITDYEEDANEILSPHPSSIAHLIAKVVVIPVASGDVYTCVARAGHNEQSASTTVFVVGELDDLATLEKLFRVPSAPVITASYEDVLQEMGSNLVLPCRVHSRSKAQVEWRDGDGNLVHGNSRFRLLPSGDLLIMGLRWTEMGNFVCTVQNAYGTVSATTFIYPTKP